MKSGDIPADFRMNLNHVFRFDVGIDFIIFLQVTDQTFCDNYGDGCFGCLCCLRIENPKKNQQHNHHNCRNNTDFNCAFFISHLKCLRRDCFFSIHFV